MKREILEQTELMVRVLPHVAREDCFALKGGTAINFFVRDMPRLSVDIDLVYLAVEPRPQTQERIGQALQRIKEAVTRNVREVTVQTGQIEGHVAKLLVRGAGGMVKVEPNLILRGTAFPPQRMEMAPRAVKQFGLRVSTATTSGPDLFGGKICAALDRQHPRDLFDIKILLENEGITPDIRRAFVVYWVSHDRPMHEIIDPPRLDFKALFESAFVGMTDDPVSYEDLVSAREKLILQLARDLDEAERKFVVSIKEGKPAWGLLGIDGLDRMPAIQWKLHNIGLMDRKKHEEQLRQLKEKLGL